jgi:hypothetical protein
LKEISLDKAGDGAISRPVWVVVSLVCFMNGEDFDVRLAEWMIGDEVSEMSRCGEQRSNGKNKCKVKDPTLAKGRLGWGTLKFIYSANIGRATSQGQGQGQQTHICQTAADMGHQQKCLWIDSAYLRLAGVPRFDRDDTSKAIPSKSVIALVRVSNRRGKISGDRSPSCSVY